VIVETPEIVTVRIEVDGGDAIEVVFTREEYAEIELSAAARGMSIEEFAIEATRERIRSESTKGRPKADRTGSS
jgi:hypothetical protein